jgi:Golgi nucleoside diphosphatase
MHKVKLKSLRIFFTTAVLFLLVTLFYLSSFKYDNFTNLVYTIVIDAGSTGSRIHVYKLLHDDLGKCRYSRTRSLIIALPHFAIVSLTLLIDNNPKTLDVKLINEDYISKIKPGLSSYSNDPDKV